MTGKQRTTEKAPPVFAMRYGAVKAAVWLNVVDTGGVQRSVYNVTVSRSYRDGDDWKDSNNFGYDDLLALSKAIDECHSFIHNQLILDRQESRAESGVSPTATATGRSSSQRRRL